MILNMGVNYTQTVLETRLRKINGMRIYSSENLARLLLDSGFTVSINDMQEKGRLCIVARKNMIPSRSRK
jgi:hypothetical protein